jgi:hypothetical protein
MNIRQRYSVSDCIALMANYIHHSSNNLKPLEGLKTSGVDSNVPSHSPQCFIDVSQNVVYTYALRLGLTFKILEI